RAIEPIHVQYSYDDQSIWVVNNSHQDHRGLKVTARVLDLDLKERFSKTASVDVAADGKSNVFTISWPKDISKTFFVLLKLEDRTAKVISENRYWLSTVPDIPGKSVETRDSYKANTVSLSDFTALQGLDPTEVHAEARFERGGSETVGRVQ